MEVVTALVVVVNDLRWATPHQGDLQGIEHQLGPPLGGPRPNDDPPAADIQHDDQVQDPAQVGCR